MILQFLWSTFLRLFLHVILIVQSKIVQVGSQKIKNKNQFIQFASELAVLEFFFFFFFLNHSQGILGINEQLI
jgi:hypothetical protein